MTERKIRFGILSILACAVAVLWLAAACGEGNEVETDLASGEWEVCGTGSTDLTVLASTMSMTEGEIQEHMAKEMRVGSVLYNYDSLFWRQPNVYEVSTGFLKDEKGAWTDTWGITIWVTEKVDQGTLPQEDRIPELLEGVPVRISDKEPLKAAAKGICTEYKCRGNSSAEEGNVTTPPATPTDEYIHEVRLKYDPLFWRQPNVFGVGEGYLGDGNGGWTETVGINIRVTKKVDQSTLPLEDRIPDCLEGVPVQIVEVRQEDRPVLQIDKEEANGSD